MFCYTINFNASVINKVTSYGRSGVEVGMRAEAKPNISVDQEWLQGYRVRINIPRVIWYILSEN